MINTKADSAPFEPILTEHEDLLWRVHAVERHLARLEEAAARVGSADLVQESLEALERVVEALEPLIREHFIHEEASPLYTTFILKRPDRAQEVARLRAEHEAMRHTITALLRTVARTDLEDSATSAIEQGWALVRTIRAHERAEHELMQGGPAAG